MIILTLVTLTLLNKVLTQFTHMIIEADLDENS